MHLSLPGQRLPILKSLMQMPFFSHLSHFLPWAHTPLLSHLEYSSSHALLGVTVSVTSPLSRAGTVCVHLPEHCLARGRCSILEVIILTKCYLVERIQFFSIWGDKNNTLNFPSTKLLRNPNPTFAVSSSNMYWGLNEGVTVEHLGAETVVVVAVWETMLKVHSL